MDVMNVNDPELSAEMFRLLGQELKTVRAKLREAERRTSTTSDAGSPSNRLTPERAQELIAENDNLRAVNAALLDQVTQLSSLKSEDDELNPLQYPEPTSDTRAEITRLLAENENLIREKEEALRNEEKLVALQEKYKRTKAKAHEYHEVLDELRDALSNSIQELEESKKAVATEIDFKQYLKGVPYEPVEGQPKLASIPAYNPALLKDVKNICKGPYSINCNEVIWSGPGIALGLVVKPIFRYNPKANGTAWTKLENNFLVGEQLDVCYHSGGKFHYLGTYERVETQGNMVMETNTLKKLDNTKMDHASRSTTLFPDFVPPSHMKMIKNMYKQGVIKLQCFGIRCVAYNQTISKRLEAVGATSVDPPVDSRKRKRVSTWATNSNKNKKRDGSSPETHWQ